MTPPSARITATASARFAATTGIRSLGPACTRSLSPAVQRMVAAALAGALALAAASCSLLPKEVEDPPPPLAAPVKWEKEVLTVRRGHVTDKVSLRARFVPARSADLYFKVGGRVRAVFVRAGDAVKAGDPIVELENDDLLFNIHKAELLLESSRLALEDSRDQAQFKGGPTANELRRQEIALQIAESELERLRQQFAATRLVAPFPGQVTAVGVKPGDNAANYAIVASLSDPRDLMVEADVDEAALVRLAVGQKARLEFTDLGGLDAGLTGEVVQLPEGQGPAGNLPGQSKRIKVRPLEPVPQAKMGMIGKIHVILQEKADVLVLPNRGLRQYAGRTYVLLQTPNGKREVDVVPGVVDDTQIEIVKGLREGDQVIAR